MSADALTSKGQTTIPKRIRDSLRMKAGDKMTFTLMPSKSEMESLRTEHEQPQASIDDFINRGGV
jgi:antitoxin PrlF